MSRIPDVALESMTAEQRSFHALVMSQRGRVRGPFRVLLHAPELGPRIAETVEHFHQETRLPMKLKEFVILLVARHQTAQFAWLVHERRAQDAGLEDSVIAAIRDRQALELPDRHYETAFNVTRDILEAGRVSDETFSVARNVFDDGALVELTILVGFYISIGVLLTTFDVEVPPGSEPLL